MVLRRRLTRLSPYVCMLALLCIFARAPNFVLSRSNLKMAFGACTSLRCPASRVSAVVAKATQGGGDLEAMAEKLQEVFDFETPGIEGGEQWRALTKIKVRTEPSMNAPQYGSRVIEKGEIFVVAEQRRAKIPTGDKHRMYLRIASTKGWVFDVGAGGDWLGKYIAVKVYEDEEGGANNQNPFGALGDAFPDMNEMFKR